MLHKHLNKERHKEAIVCAEEFERSMSGKQPDIQQMLSKSLADRISTNHQKLSSITNFVVAKTLHYMAIALDVERDVDDSQNYGNFLNLLNFRIDAGDLVLKNHLSIAERNATYLSNTI